MYDLFDPRNLEYQQSAKPHKIIMFSDMIDGGVVFPPIRLRRLPSGQLRVLDGTHRALAHLVSGKPVQGIIEND